MFTNSKIITKISHHRRSLGVILRTIALSTMASSWVLQPLNQGNGQLAKSLLLKTETASATCAISWHVHLTARTKTGFPSISGQSTSSLRSLVRTRQNCYGRQQLSGISMARPSRSRNSKYILLPMQDQADKRLGCLISMLVKMSIASSSGWLRTTGPQLLSWSCTEMMASLWFISQWRTCFDPTSYINQLCARLS
jgi:hypothetical protein